MVAVILSALVGYLVGLRQGTASQMTALHREAAGNLRQRVEALSLLRTGEPSKAINALEEEVDQLVLTISANEGHEEEALLPAKAYRSVVPPPASRAKALEATFTRLPAPKADQCSPALRRLMASGGSSK